MILSLSLCVNWILLKHLTAGASLSIFLAPRYLPTEMFIRRLHLNLQRFSKGADGRNAAGLTFVLSGVSGVLSMPFYQTLVTDGKIKQDELDGTRHNLSAAITILKNTPAEKIEAMVAQYNDELTEHMNRFNSVGYLDYLSAFREAQIMEGYVTSIMGKARLRS